MTHIAALRLAQTIIHYSLHFLFPVVPAWLFFRDKWQKAWLIMIVTMVVDIDHLWAVPVFDPCRCGVGYHFLHSYYAIAVYGMMLFFPKLRIVAVGLLLHMFTDFQDCLWNAYISSIPK
ncbi:DUF6122 family protein [Chitinophagaceae bacterium MMS25-I14]